MNKKEVATSKFLSLILRHVPESIGIELDENGWADTDLLIQKINDHNHELTLDMLKHIVDTNPKKRFTFDDNFKRIRANQGHSITIELGLSPEVPPEVLYHGTALQYANSIIEQGIKKQNRLHVHLSKDVETAKSVGQRHGKPILFEINALAMFQDRFDFFLSENGVWLTDHVPAQYLRFVNFKGKSARQGS